MINEFFTENGFKHPFKKDNITLSFIFSYSDLASINIFNNFRKVLNLNRPSSNNFTNNNQKNLNFDVFHTKYNDKDLIFYGFDNELVNLNDLDLKGDAFIFLSRHSSSSKKPCLTVHTTGNFSEAQFGGYDNKISEPAPFLHKSLISSLNKLSKDSEEVVLEATHHGPYIEKPHVFIEIGSDKKRWENKELSKTICDSIFNTLKNINLPKYYGIGIGGSHYAREFTKISIETPISIPIIIPKYALKHIDEKMIKDLSKYSKNFILDWKGLSSHKDKIISLIDKNNFNYFRNDKIKKYFRNIKS